MSLRTKFFALTYDRQMAKTEKAGLRAFRERLLAGASGDVLEIGGGTGANLPCYGPDVGSLTLTEPQPPMLRRLERAVRTHRPDARVLRAPAEDLPFDDHSFDVAVSTLVLCGVDDQPRALRELCRVLRPGGRLLFIEHLRSEDPALALLQDRMNWLNRLVVCCDCNRPTLNSVRQAGFTVDQLQHTALPEVPKFVAPAILGSATIPAAAPSGSTPPAGTAASSPDDQRPGRAHPVIPRRVRFLSCTRHVPGCGGERQAATEPTRRRSRGESLRAGGRGRPPGCRPRVASGNSFVIITGSDLAELAACESEDDLLGDCHDQESWHRDGRVPAGRQERYRRNGLLAAERTAISSVRPLVLAAMARNPRDVPGTSAPGWAGAVWRLRPARLTVTSVGARSGSGPCVEHDCFLLTLCNSSNTYSSSLTGC